jgi:hypothetical protein
MIHVKVTDAQRRELEQVSRQAVGRVALRAHMVLLSVRGYSVPQIAAIHDCGCDVVRTWLHRYEQEGVAAYLSDYVVPRLSAWQARATLTFAVIAAARRATQGHVDWPATDIWRLARALRDRAPGLYAVLIALLEHVEQSGPTD